MSPGQNASQGSLRERKKEKLRLTLIKVATELFREQTFDRTRMDDIAAVAEVGITTVYNYFPNKQRLLVAIIENMVAASQKEVEKVIEGLPEDPVDAIEAMILADYGDMDQLEDKRLWRELLATMLVTSEGHVEIEQARNRFRTSLKVVIEAYIGKGRIKRNCDVEAMVDIIYAIYAYHFRSLACFDGSKTADEIALVRRDIEVLISAG